MNDPEEDDLLKPQKYKYLKNTFGDDEETLFSKPGDRKRAQERKMVRREERY